MSKSPPPSYIPGLLSTQWPLGGVGFLITAAIFYAYSALVAVLEPYLKQLAVHVEEVSQSAHGSVFSHVISSVSSASIAASSLADSDKASSVSNSQLSTYSVVSQQDDEGVFVLPSTSM